MRKNANAFHHLSGAILHQTVIGGNIWFALGSIDNQGFDFIAATLQFNTRREARTPQPGDAKLMNTFN